MNKNNLAITHGRITHNYGADCETCEQVFIDNPYVQKIIAKRGTDKLMVMFHDTKNGCWEFNYLSLPLIHNYTHGLSSIVLVKQTKNRNNINSRTYLKPPKWYYYIYFGFKILINILKEDFKKYSILLNNYFKK